MMAADYLVDTHLDVVAADGKTSLRKALTAAAVDGQNDHDIIEFASNIVDHGGIELNGTQLVIDSDVTHGPGAAQIPSTPTGRAVCLRFPQAPRRRFAASRSPAATRPRAGGFSITATFHSDSVNVTGNSSQYGAGVWVETTGSLNVTNSTIAGNVASAEGGGIGGFFNTGQTLTITGSTFSGNEASAGGGLKVQSVAAIAAGPAVISITNSTFSDNRAGWGGAAHIANSPGKATQASFVNSTVVENRASQRGGGVYNVNVTAAGDVFKLANTIVAKNTDTSGGGLDNGSGSLNVGGGSVNNLIGLTYTGIVITPGTQGNQVGTTTAIDPLLAPLGDYGGPTRTHALLPASTAINAGSNTAATGIVLDQRGANYDRTVGSTVDIGAVEAHVIQATPTAR